MHVHLLGPCIGKQGMIKYVCLISNSMASQCMINGRQTDLYCRLVPLATNNSCKLYIKTKIASCLVTKVKKDWQNCDEVPQTEMLPRGRKKMDDIHCFKININKLYLDKRGTYLWLHICHHGQASHQGKQPSDAHHIAEEKAHSNRSNKSL